MSIVELLAHLRSRDITVWAEGDSLRYRAPTGALDETLRTRIREQRGQLLEFLREADVADHSTLYVPMRDGVRLAADIFRPKRAGLAVADPLPVVWSLERYQRSELAAGLLMTRLDTQPWLKDLVRNDYVVAVVDARGSGASGGVRGDEFSDEEVRDCYELTEWFAGQPWCDGNIGMYGASYQGIVQYLAAGLAPPHLKAIFAEMAMFDLYHFLYPGGVFRDDFPRRWSALVRELDTERVAAPVAADTGYAREVLDLHRSNVDVFGRAGAFPLRDSADPHTGLRPHIDRTPSSAIAAINASGIPVFHLGGWYDMWSRDTVLWFTNLTVPQRLVMGAWSHSSRGGIDLVAEHVRWYDHWLKGIDTGVMAEPPVRYFAMSASPGQEWRTSPTWPPPQIVDSDYFLYRGGLSPDPMSEVDGADEYIVDYSATSGTTTRWSNGVGSLFRYDLSPNDRKALTYTTPPLEHDLEVTGHPIVHLWVSSTHSDGDFFVYLEEVDEAGESHYVTEGSIRASHRALGRAPYRNLGLPYHPSTGDLIDALPDHPVELVIDLHPTSNIFVRGRCVRLAITCRDRDNAHTPIVDPPPVVRIHHGANHPSRLVLPVMPSLQGSA
ncbi:MAG TPA: CocE/NonD family hydrolase [Candidatus Limnocylindrales bacterium]|nr:CocE/NonD family hydrolase [Candidatus Limnocylindrales bacterium]